MLSYVGSVSLGFSKSASVVVAIQLVTVWFALHVAGARRTVRYTAFVLMAYAAVAGVWGAFIDAEGPWWVYLASGLLYLIAPFAIIRNVAQRPALIERGSSGRSVPTSSSGWRSRSCSGP